MIASLQLLADWLLTWLVHATVAAALVLAGGRWLVRELRLRDALWKSALLLPLLTSAISVAMGTHGGPAMSVWHVAVQDAAGSIGPVRVQARPVAWLTWFALALLLVPAAAVVLRKLHGSRTQRTVPRIARRIESAELDVEPVLLQLHNRPVCVSVSPNVDGAAVTGTREICVSPEFLKLGKREKACVLAHEVAHLQRADYAWQKFADCVASALAIQPLIGWVVQQLRRDAEFICDEIAVGQTGDRVGYLRTLTTFAAQHESQAVAVVGYRGSQIVQRAERVLGLDLHARPRPHTRLRAVCAVAIMLGVLLVVPHVKTAANSARVSARVVTRASAPPTRITVTVDPGSGSRPH